MPIELRRSAFAPCGFVPRVAEAMTQRRCGTLNLLRKCNFFISSDGGNYCPECDTIVTTFMEQKDVARGLSRTNPLTDLLPGRLLRAGDKCARSATDFGLGERRVMAFAVPEGVQGQLLDDPSLWVMGVRDRVRRLRGQV